ncbi:tyrosine-type recombinase/integrase [Bradyrhizobium oligotrophicum]|uniref:tyrosine-type recombinase/integrase n=1 Tax=Bradyrhizobium oligotrophicum TaxID=44255 RepID=UPI003EB91241
MAKGMLTAAAVVKLKASERRVEVPDAGAPGLRLVVHPSGRKVWTMRFRRPGGKQGNLTLGPLDTTGDETRAPQIGHPLTLSAARVLANEIARQRAQDVDVIAVQRSDRHRKRLQIAERSANSFADAAKLFIQERTTRKTGEKPRRWIEEARLLGWDFSEDEPAMVKGGLADRFRDKPVLDFDGDEIYALIAEARRHGVPGMARRSAAPSDARGRHMAAALSAFFKWLHRERRIKVNPVLGLSKPPNSPSRRRFLTDAEIKKFWTACTALGSPFGPMLKLLLLTGQRLNEIARLHEAELTDEAIRLPGSRTKNALPHDVPLSSLAKEVLAEVQRVPNSKYVFSTNGRTPVSGFSKAKTRIDDLLDIEPWVFHDLRRSAATGMAEIGIQPHVIEAILNHVSGHKASVAGIYNRAAYANEKREALEKWAEHLRRIVS